ncbi:hypothetical protein COU80_05315 [Candidatus Peregrinibacteria bacterium CG10_big_fil_rev_8_21_14_0_10_55_24]|nr:MAG: hypothetical protein COU80_05315 [Candidatus Peregrinibacteria bacterium CG10_big_fil_rev_8_21_14_0_10_55_24]
MENEGRAFLCRNAFVHPRSAAIVGPLPIPLFSIILYAIPMLSSPSTSRSLARYVPEIVLGCFALFFFLRELGTFPAAWTDDSLFMMVAREVADGRGYAIPLLDSRWTYPYFLAVGPTLILPSALTIKLFGFSVAAARISMVFFLAATAVVSYVFTKKIFGIGAARWSLALLVSLSAFVNTGKPVLGEIPAFLFLLLGLLFMQHWQRGWRYSVVAGMFFGLSVMTKLTYGMIFPTLGFLLFLSILQRRWRESTALSVMLLSSVLTYLPWRLLEMSTRGGFAQEIVEYLSSGIQNDTVPFNVLVKTPELLLRVPFLAFGVFLLLGSVGLWQARGKLTHLPVLTILILVVLFILYFLDLYGWYRYLLPAHLLLLPFVSAGARTLLGRRLATIVLSLIIIAQAQWQFTHKGASSSTEAAEAAAFVEEHYQEKELLVNSPEVFVRLSRNPHWRFLIPKEISPTVPQEYYTVTSSLRCIPILRKLQVDQQEPYGDTLVKAGGRYMILPVPNDCPMRR